LIGKKIESLFTGNSDKKNKFRIEEKARTSTNFWVNEDLVRFAADNIYANHDDAAAVAEYYIFNSIDIANEISKAMNSNNQIERLLLFREIRELSSSLGKLGYIENFEDITPKKRELANEEHIAASRKSWNK
jgi:hypothetical protein